jgi:toxin CptA
VLLVAVLAALAWPLTALPPAWATAMGLAGIGWGLRRARMDLAQPACTLAWRGEGEVEIRGTGGALALSAVNVRWRGALATLEGRDPAGKLRRLAWWPDTLPPPARRALRLATDHRPASAPLPNT